MAQGKAVRGIDWVILIVALVVVACLISWWAVHACDYGCTPRSATLFRTTWFDTAERGGLIEVDLEPVSEPDRW